ILVPAVSDKCGLWVFQDVAHPLQRPVLPLWLFVDGDVEAIALDRVAHRDQMRRAGRIGCRQMADAAPIEKSALTVAQHLPILRRPPLVAYRFTGIVR